MKVAINDAKANLLSLGDQLQAQVSQLIDAGPIAGQIEGLEDQLSGRRRARQRLGLLEDIEEAKRELKLALLESGPLADRIEKLQEELDFSRTRNQRRGLVEDIQDANRELRQAREWIIAPIPGARERVKTSSVHFQRNVPVIPTRPIKEFDADAYHQAPKLLSDAQKELLEADPVARFRKRVKKPPRMPSLTSTPRPLSTRL